MSHPGDDRGTMPTPDDATDRIRPLLRESDLPDDAASDRLLAALSALADDTVPTPSPEVLAFLNGGAEGNVRSISGGRGPRYLVTTSTTVLGIVALTTTAAAALTGNIHLPTPGHALPAFSAPANPAAARPQELLTAAQTDPAPRDSSRPPAPTSATSSPVPPAPTDLPRTPAPPPSVIVAPGLPAGSLPTAPPAAALPDDGQGSKHDDTNGTTSVTDSPQDAQVGSTLRPAESGGSGPGSGAEPGATGDAQANSSAATKRASPPGQTPGQDRGPARDRGPSPEATPRDSGSEGKVKSNVDDEDPLSPASPAR